jgi:hypothetical protein
VYSYSISARGSHLGLELLVFFFLLVAVLFNLLLSLSLGVSYPLGAICSREYGQVASARLSGSRNLVHSLAINGRASQYIIESNDGGRNAGITNLAAQSSEPLSRPETSISALDLPGCKRLGSTYIEEGLNARGVLSRLDQRQQLAWFTQHNSPCYLDLTIFAHKPLLISDEKR